MKDVVVLEINGKKEVLGQIEMDTPSQFLLVNSTEPVLNNCALDNFIDEIFVLTVEEFANEVNGKIDNVYITFIDDNDEFVCSIVIDKLNHKKMTYRMKVIDWKSTGYTFKYLDELS